MRGEHQNAVALYLFYDLQPSGSQPSIYNRVIFVVITYWSQGLTFDENHRIDSRSDSHNIHIGESTLSLSYTVNAAVSVKLDSHKLRWK